MLPVIFISHGPPTFALEANATTRFWSELGASLPRPKAILCISAHWMARQPRFTGKLAPNLIHDYMGFPAELQQLTYSAPGAPDWAQRAVADCLAEDIPAVVDDMRGLDHGVWVPLMHMFPAADVPVFAVALQATTDVAWHYRFGSVLSALRAEGVLIIASGGATHNLHAASWHSDAPVDQRAELFDQWLSDAVLRNDVQALQAYREAPEAHWNHPSAEHFLPLIVALGTANATPPVAIKKLHHGFVHGSLSLAAYSWE